MWTNDHFCAVKKIVENCCSISFNNTCIKISNLMYTTPCWWCILYTWQNTIHALYIKHILYRGFIWEMLTIQFNMVYACSAGTIKCIIFFIITWNKLSTESTVITTWHQNSSFFCIVIVRTNYKESESWHAGRYHLYVNSPTHNL